MKTETKEKNTVVKKKSKGKKALKILCIILAVIVAGAGVCAVLSSTGNKANIEKITAFEPVEKDDRLVPEKDEDGNWTFTTDRDFKVMQLTDVHIGGGFMSLKKDAMAINAVAAMIKAEEPDLVIVTGDVSYPVPFQAGTFNNLSSAEVFAALMEQMGVYWTLGFGNHDTEAYSYYSREDISNFYGADARDNTYCLFESGPEDVDGYGNQIINVKNSDGIVTQSLFVFDSHSYVDGDVLGIMWKYDNIHENQVQWYEESLNKINAKNAEIAKEKNLRIPETVKSAAFFHIPLTEQKDAWYEYADNGFSDTENVKYHYGIAGEGKKVVYSGIGEDGLFEKMLELGSTQAVFCGHDHYNNFSLEYKGIRLTYGMSVDYLAYPGIYKEGSQRGCTVITFSPDGSFDCKAESYYQEKYSSVYDKEEVVMQELTTVEIADEYK